MAMALTNDVTFHVKKDNKKGLFLLDIDVDSCNPADTTALYVISMPRLVPVLC